MSEGPYKNVDGKLVPFDPIGVIKRSQMMKLADEIVALAYPEDKFSPSYDQDRLNLELAILSSMSEITGVSFFE